MVAVVVDNSVLMAIVFEEEPSLKSADMLQKFRASIICPEICLYEYGNAIRSGVLRDRLSEEDGMGAFSRFENFGLKVCETVTAQSLPAIGRLAIRRRLSLYDAAYLWLAIEQSASLASYDGPLIAAARAELVPVIEWGSL